MLLKCAPIEEEEDPDVVDTGVTEVDPERVRNRKRVDRSSPR